jgi:hypothetical protein
MTLAELRSVAAEAGIDPRFVELAAGRLDTPPEARRNALAGGPTHWHLRSTIPGEIAERDLDRILQVIRSTLREKGDVSEIWGRLEWSHAEAGSTVVGISSHDGATEIDVTASKSEEAVLMHGLAVPFGSLLGVALLKAILGLTAAQATPFVPVMGLVAYAGSRAGWTLRSRWWERRLRRLMDLLGSTVQEVARLPGPESDDTADGAA